MQYSPNNLALPWLISFALFMENLDSTIINTAIPSMANDFGVYPLTLKLAITSYLLSLVLILPVSGYIADRFSTKRTFMAAIIIFIFGSLACGFSVNLPMLIVSRIFQGVGSALMMPTGKLILLRTTPKNRMMKALSIIGLTGQLGAALGPFVGGALTTWLSWRAAFFINLPAGCITFWLVNRWVTSAAEVEKTDKPFDKYGFLLFGTGITLLSVLIVIGKDIALSEKEMTLGLLIAMVLLCSYFYYAKKTPSAIIQFTPFRVHTFRIAVWGSLCIRITTNSLPFVLPLLFQLSFGFTAFHSGTMLLTYAAGTILAKLTTPKLLKLLGFRGSFITCVIGLSIMCLIFSQLTTAWPFLIIIPICTITGLICSTIFSTLQGLTYQDIPCSERSQATGLASLFQQFAVNLGVCTSAFLLTNFNSLPGNLISLRAFHITFIVLALISLSSLFIFSRLKTARPN